MAINDLIVTTLGARHLFSLNNTTGEESGITSPTPSTITGGSYSFVTEPCCEGYTHSLQSLDGADYTTKSDGGVIENKNDINSADSSYNTSARTIILWARVNGINTPSCVYEEGGGINNMAFLVGLGKAFTFQAADAGQPFLIAQSHLSAQIGRNYFLTGIWQHKNVTGDYNQVVFYVNGVLQETIKLDGVNNFPSHTGDIVVGNTTDSLKTYNESTMPLVQRRKWANMLGLFNGFSLSLTQAREIFERTVFPTVTIGADTVANQQTAVDVLIGNSYLDNNCAIRILQATDTTNYTLLIDNITFKRVDELRDIHIQFVGTGTLTIENANGSNVYETSTPAEVEQTSGVLIGGGSIILINGTKRLTSAVDLANETISGNLYIDIDSDVTLNFSNVRVDSGKVYNANSSHTVTINASNGCVLTANDAGTGNGQVNIQRLFSFELNGLKTGTEVRVYRVSDGSELAGIESSGPTFSFDYAYTADVAVWVAIHHIDYMYIKLAGVTLSNANVSIPVQQQDDTTYANPE